MDHDEDHPMNNANTNNNDQQRPNSSSGAAGDENNNHNNTTTTTHTESFVFTGTAPAFLATMQNIVNRIIMRDQQPEQRRSASATPSSSQSAGDDDDVDMRLRDDVASSDGARTTTASTTLQSQSDATAPSSTPTASSSVEPEQPATSSTSTTGDAAPATAQPSAAAAPIPDSLPNPPTINPSGRPIRPLPRPHSHVHAHTPFGVIDLFAFNVNMTVGGSTPPQPELHPRPQSQPQPQPQSQSQGQGQPQPQPHPNPHPHQHQHQHQHQHPHPRPQSQPQAPHTPLTATFTFNLGPEAFAGFEAMFLNHFQKEREPDMERAKTLLRGMQTVSQGLVRRLERAGGVPGGQGSEDQSSGCAVCWGPLLEGVEPGEWDSAAQKEAKEKHAAEARDNDDANVKEQPEEDEFRGRIVALPCAHVYHAECLLPWFSRNTTCPTCRFDIDPDSLTWNPQPPPAQPETDLPEDIPGPGPGPGPDGLPFNIAHTHDEGYRLNAAEAERLNGVFASLLRGFVGDGAAAQVQAQQQQQQQQTRQRQEENQRDGVAAQQPSAQPQAEASTQTPATMLSSSLPPPPSSSLPSAPPLPPTAAQLRAAALSTSTNLPQTHGLPPPPLPPQRLHPLPGLFRLPPMPLLLFPTRPSGANAPPQGQTQTHAQTQTQALHHRPQQAAQGTTDREHAGQQDAPIRDSNRTDLASEASQRAPTPTSAPAQQSQPQPQPSQQPQQQQQPQQPHPRVPLFFNFPHVYTGFHGFPGAGAGTGANAGAGAGAGAGAARPAQEQQQPHPPNADANPTAGPNPTATATATAHVFTHFPPPFFPPFGGERMRHPGAPRNERERERRQWVPPEPVGRTLRQRVEAKEQELGLRCDDVICLFAPTDDEPVPSETMDEGSKDMLKTRVQPHGAYDTRGRLCEHKFHPACLVASARVAGVDDEEMDMENESEIELACPVCRADGTLSHKEWQEGVKSLQETS